MNMLFPRLFFIKIGFMKSRLLLFFVAVCTTLVAQDDYHQGLIDLLKSDYNIDVKDFVLDNNEAAINSDIYVYGGASRSVTSVIGQPYSEVLRYKLNTAKANPWDSGTGTRSNIAIAKGEIVLLAFWGRRISQNSEINIFVEHATTFEKEVYFNLALTQDFSQYFIAFEAAQDYTTQQIAMGIHMGTAAQEYEIAGFTALNLGDQYKLSDVPSVFSSGNYEGNEPDAAWRAPAAVRIENIRKADLGIIVKDMNGGVVNDATVTVEMQKHDFGFGSAFVTCRLPGNNCYDATYVEKITNLDGEGHGFNVGVTENALKWDGWEEEWLGTPAQTVSAVKWLDDNGVSMRGHTLIWPGWNTLPDDLFENRTDLAYLRNRITGRINRMMMDSVLSDLIQEWDVLNEITQNRDLETAFQTDPNFSTGREIYPEILKQINQVSPKVKNYINDYVVLSGGGSGASVVNRYKSYIQEIIDSGAKVDGIGFQCHIGTQPTSILKVEQTLNEFYQQFGKRMKITEYDINGRVDEETQAKYLTDFLTMVFSHPGVDAFIMWGFWGNNHWKDNAPMFDGDWNLKPSGEAFNQLVFNDWWTDETQSVDANGAVSFRAFKGTHKITVNRGGETKEVIVELTEDAAVEVVLGTTSIDELSNIDFTVDPNPATHTITVSFDSSIDDALLNIYDLTGRLIAQPGKIINGQHIAIDVPAGTYIVELMAGEKSFKQKLVVF